MARATTDPTRIDDPSKIDPRIWLSFKDAFPRMCDCLESSKDAVDELGVRLRIGEWASARQQVDFNGEKLPLEVLSAEFWKHSAYLSTEIDVNGVDYLIVHCPDHSLSAGPPEYFLRTAHFERDYPTIAAPPPHPPTTTATPPAPQTAPQRQRSRKQRLILDIAAEEFPDGYDQIGTNEIMKRVGNRLQRQRLAVPGRDTFLRALDRRRD